MLLCINSNHNIIFLDVRQAFFLSASRVQVQEDVLQRLQITINQGLPFETNYRQLSTSNKS